MKKLCILISLLFAELAFFLFVNIHDFNQVNEETQKIAKSKESISGSYNENLITHRMIKFDIDNGITPVREAGFAYGNTQRFMDDVKNTCSIVSSNTEKYITCANKLLADNFLYKASSLVSSAWATHYSDCDLNVYLLLDALNQINKTGRIVYAPGHAFLSFTDEKTGLPVYWETTANNNSGELADMKDDYLYRKTMHHFYYTPYKADFAEELYAFIVIDKLPENERDIEIANRIKTLPDNPVLQDYWFLNKKALTESDVDVLTKLVNIEITANYKTLRLADYYIKRHDKEKASSLLEYISDDNCNKDCLALKSQLSVYYWGLINSRHFYHNPLAKCR